MRTNGAGARIAVLLAVMLSACGSAEMPGQADAMRIVWTEAYVMDVPPPQVTWGDTGPDVGGLSWGNQRIEVAWPGNFYQSAFTHELMHVRQYWEGIVDANHQRVDDWQLVQLVNGKLQADGL